MRSLGWLMLNMGFWLALHTKGFRKSLMKWQSRFCHYLIVTIICEYKILRFWDSNDFAGINFCATEPFLVEFSQKSHLRLAYYKNFPKV